MDFNRNSSYFTKLLFASFHAFHAFHSRSARFLFFFVCLFVYAKADTCIVLRNIFNKWNDKKLLWKLSILWIS